MRSGDLHSDGQAEPGAAGGARPALIQTDEAFKDPLAFAFRDPWAVIFDVHHGMRLGAGSVVTRQRCEQKGKSGYSTGDPGIGVSQIGHCTLFIGRHSPELREFPAFPAPRYLPSFFPLPLPPDFLTGAAVVSAAGAGVAGVAAGVSGFVSAGLTVPASASAFADF